MKEETKRRVRRWGRLLFFVYLLLLCYFLFFAEIYGRKNWSQVDYRYNLELFREIKRFWIYREKLGFWPVFLNIAGNIIGFVPFGALLPIVHRNLENGFLVILLGFSSSLLVECLQLLMKVGSFDVDDLFLNTVGAATGYLVYWICNKIRRRIYGKAV